MSAGMNDFSAGMNDFSGGMSDISMSDPMIDMGGSLDVGSFD